ncbi:MAG: GNAT family N-acetyltransferase [Candidatus Promineofilum sp.]|nr:GNAT family N-acetyltransferase [Promineifilum sp.]
MTDTPLTLELAQPDDAAALADISRRAFETDSAVGGTGPGGPPGYDTAAWQRSMMTKASAYWKLLLDGQLIGGAIVFSYPRGRYYLARIFLDPDYHRQGLGLRAMEALLAAYPEARVWRLETPPWNRRTRAFYKKLAFRVVREMAEDVFFQKTMSDGHGV